MKTILKKAGALFHPERYHGWGKTRHFFEGWYYKIIDRKGQHALAIIPGVAMGEHNNRHAFIQVLDGINNRSRYIKFDIHAFSAADDKFEICIGRNRFSATSIELDTDFISGSLAFSNLHPWPAPWYSPGIMGPYAFVPFMECYHGVLSMDHNVKGNLFMDGSPINFDGGRGYTEKDWGHSFPTAYFWMQSNHFSRPGISLKASVARIPWMRSAFTGFIAGVLIDGALIRFTTYNKSRLTKSYANMHQVEISIENNKYSLDILAQRSLSTSLASPLHGFMEGRIEESMTSQLEVRLIERKTGSVLLNDTGIHAGLEVAGNIEQIVVKN